MRMRGSRENGCRNLFLLALLLHLNVPRLTGAFTSTSLGTTPPGMQTSTLVQPGSRLKRMSRRADGSCLELRMQQNSREGQQETEPADLLGAPSGRHSDHSRSSSVRSTFEEKVQRKKSKTYASRTITQMLGVEVDSPTPQRQGMRGFLSWIKEKAKNLLTIVGNQVLKLHGKEKLSVSEQVLSQPQSSIKVARPPTRRSSSLSQVVESETAKDPVEKRSFTKPASKDETQRLETLLGGYARRHGEGDQDKKSGSEMQELSGYIRRSKYADIGRVSDPKTGGEKTSSSQTMFRSKYADINKVPSEPNAQEETKGSKTLRRSKYADIGRIPEENSDIVPTNNGRTGSANGRTLSSRTELRNTGATRESEEDRVTILMEQYANRLAHRQNSANGNKQPEPASGIPGIMRNRVVNSASNSSSTKADTVSQDV